MNELGGNVDYLQLFALAAAMGALGGLAAELLNNVRGRPGNLRLWSYSKSGRLLQLGFLGPVVLGAVAGMIILIFLPFDQQTSVVNGLSITTRTYDPLKIVPLALAAGVAGSAVLQAAQTRLLAMVSEQRIGAVETAGKDAVDRTAARAKDEATKAMKDALETELKPQLEHLLSQARDALPAGLGAQLESMGISSDTVAAIPKSGITFGAGPDLDTTLEGLTASLATAMATSIDAHAEQEKAAISAAARGGDGA